MKYRVIAIMFCIVFAGCVTVEENLRQRFGGVHKSRLLGQWGAPDHKEPDGRGGEIWIYTYKVASVKPVKKSTDVEQESEEYKTKKTTTIYPSTTTTKTFNKSFYIDSDGIIYDVAYGARYN